MVPVMSERPPILRFGPYEADLFTREELHRAIWPKGTFVAFERGLTSAMRKVREALDERAESPVYIETLTGRGYRFMAPVSAVERAPVNHSGRTRWLAPVAAVLLVGFGEGSVGPNTLAAERFAAAEELSAYACLLKSQGRFEEGLAASRKAHAIAPESARFTAEVGLHLHATLRYDDEMVMLLRAVRQDGRSPDAWLHLGLAYARRARFDEAIDALERASQMSNGERAQYWLHWARAQQRAVIPGGGSRPG
jgi:tetratricopeptide (TPR) repeat protein